MKINNGTGQRGDGCVAQKPFSLTISAVGSAGIGGAYTEATMVGGCTQAEMSKTTVEQGIASNDPTKAVLGMIRDKATTIQSRPVCKPAGDAAPSLK